MLQVDGRRPLRFSPRGSLLRVVVDKLATMPIDAPQYATLPRRGAAQLVDLIVIGFVLQGCLLVSAFTQSGGPLGQVFADGGTVPEVFGFGLVLLCGYSGLCELLFSGQSIGKSMLGIRVVDDTGRGPRFESLLARNVLRAVDVLPVMYGLGFATMCLTRPPRRLGDMIAGTYVVETRDNPSAGVRMSDMKVFLIAVGAFVLALVVEAGINIVVAVGYLYWKFLTQPT